jgi:hypothetical protein
LLRPNRDFALGIIPAAKKAASILLEFKWPFVDAKPSSECPADPAVERRFIAEAGSTLLHRTEPAVATARLL